MEWITNPNKFGSWKDTNEAIEKTAKESQNFHYTQLEKQLLEQRIIEEKEEMDMLYHCGDPWLAYKKAGTYLDLVQAYNKIARIEALKHHPNYQDFLEEDSYELD
jgi:hypothetical protein